MAAGRALFCILLLLSMAPSAFAAACPGSAISSSYNLTADLTSSGAACITITGSNMVLDCKGYKITNTGSSGSGVYGIYISGARSNVTIRNCAKISNYNIGIYSGTANTNNLKIYNNTIYNSSYNAFYLEAYGVNNTLENNTAYNTTYHGFDVRNNVNCTLKNNAGYKNAGNGILFLSTNYSTVYNNTMYNNTYDGIILLTGSSYNTIANNSFYINKDDGIQIDGSCYRNSLADNSIYNNSARGIYFNNNANSYSNFTNNTISGSGSYGVWVKSSSNSAFVGNTVYSNTGAGIRVESSNSNSFANNTAYSCLNGFYVTAASANNTLSGNTLYLNSNSGISVGGAAGNTNALENNTAYGNAWHGFYIYGSNQTSLYNNTAYNNSGYGFFINSSNANTISSSTSYNNTDGFYVYNSSNNTVSWSTSYNNALRGFYVDTGSRNNFTNDVAYGNGHEGFVARSSNYTVFANDSAYDNLMHGFYVYGSRQGNFTGNLAYGNLLGGFYFLSGSTGNTLTNNTMHDNEGYALEFLSSTPNDISGTVIYAQDYFISSDSSGITATNLTLESGGSLILFPSVTYGADQLDNSNLAIGSDFVSLDSSSAPSFNTSATITLAAPSCPATIYTKAGYQTSYDEIISGGEICTDCTILSCGSGYVTFTVPHFTGYASGAGANLTIYNDGPVDEGGTINFTAEYINATSGSHITGATCGLALANGSTYSMSDNGSAYVWSHLFPTAGTFSYNVTCSATGYDTLTANDTYQVNGNATPSNGTITLSNANATVISTSKYHSDITAGNYTTEGGNITSVNITTNASTEKWAGFYGNTSADIRLSENNTDLYMYLWAWDSSNGGVVCLSTNPSLSTFTAYGATGSDIDSAWGFTPTDADSGANTYNSTGCSLQFGTGTLSNASYADTGSAGGFQTCAFKSAASPAKNEMLFCVNLTYNGQIYNGQTGDFELMVPAPESANTFETYYFYMSLN